MKTESDRMVDLVKLVNATKIHGKPIYEYYSLEGYSLWSFYQEKIGEQLLAHVFDAPSRVHQTKSKPRLLGLRRFVLQMAAITISIVSFLIILVRRPRVFIYTNDITVGKFKNDPRIQGIYDYLNAKKTAFAEIVHIRSNSAFIVNFLRRRRPVIYLEAIDYLAPLARRLGYRCQFSALSDQDVDRNPVPSGQDDVVRKVVLAYSHGVERSVFRIRALIEMFSRIKPSVLVGIDDYRSYHEILVAIRHDGIRSILLQHARFNKYITGGAYYGIPAHMCVVPDFYVVWNKYWKSRLMALSPPFAAVSDRVIVGGKPHAAQSRFAVTPRAEDDVLSVLIPHEPHADKDALTNYMRRFLECKAIKILYLLRKDLSENIQTKEIPADILNDDRFVVAHGLTEEISAKIDLVAGTHSTFLYEMPTAERPVAVLKDTKRTQAGDLVENGLAGFVELNEPDICGRLNNLASVDAMELRRRREVLEIKTSIHETFDSLLFSFAK